MDRRLLATQWDDSRSLSRSVSTLGGVVPNRALLDAVPMKRQRWHRERVRVRACTHPMTAVSAVPSPLHSAYAVDTCHHRISEQVVFRAPEVAGERIDTVEGVCGRQKAPHMLGGMCFLHALSFLKSKTERLVGWHSDACCSSTTTWVGRRKYSCEC